MRIAFISRNIASTVHLKNTSAYAGQHSSSGNNNVATITNFDPSIPSTVNNLLAYRPNYTDNIIHKSGLAGMFVNIEGLFPCVVGPPEYQSVCKLFTFEGDGFRNGHTVIDAADRGNNFDFFNGTNIATYGFAFTGCPTFSTECFPLGARYSIVCLLPRNRCG